MASLKLEHIYKVYPDGTKAVNDFSLEIKDGEFLVLVGPSGCGKTTTLRMIAGLEDITAGELYLDDEIINDLEPKDRDMAMVFQDYALYPHLTVYENMAFGLRLRHVPEEVIQEKVLWAAEILSIKDYLDKKPRSLSGGQRQRVALGRAILREPKVMLLDEPLSNLDPKLRTQMRTEIAKLHQKLKTTFIYVTHDQTEAMTLGDRVVVMKDGRIQQVDTPKNLYNYPVNEFVAGFIGTPQMNFFDCTLLKKDEEVEITFQINGYTSSIPYHRLIKVVPSYLDGKKEVVLGVRCEHVKIVSSDTPFALKAKVSHIEELGEDSLVYASLNTKAESIDSTKGQIIIKTKDASLIHPEDLIYLSFDMDNTYYFDKEKENTILPRIPQYNVLTASVKSNRLQVLGSEIPLPDALKTGDIENAELHVPIDAFLFGQYGIHAKIVKMERIENERLAHLLSAGRIFFAKVDSDYSEGAEISVALDFTRLTLMYQGQEIFSPIALRDSLLSTFYNYSTVISKNDDPDFQEFKEERIQQASSHYDEEIKEENAAFEVEKGKLNSATQNLEKEKGKKELSELMEKNRKEIEDIRKEIKEKIKKQKENFLAERNKTKEDNDAYFEAKKQKEIQEYKEFKENNNDKETLKRRSDEYHLFKDNYQTDKENTLTYKLNLLTLKQEAELSSLKSAFKRKIELLKKEIHDKKKEVRKLSHPLRNLEKDHQQKIKALESEKEKAMQRASLIFFFRFPGDYYAIATDTIANKLIQGLGTRVFTREFRIEIPHDAYIESNKANAFTVMVEGNLDYGNTFFVRCTYLDANGNKQFVFLKSEVERKIGEQIRLAFDIEKVQITETSMNIRLY